MKKILVTGGLGFIGSHTIVELIQSNYQVVAYDNLSNSSVEILDRVQKITGKCVEFVEGDILDVKLLDKVFRLHSFDAVLHFAGLKSVSGSIQSPIAYYKNNVEGSISLIDCMNKNGVKTFIFSSSATVYGDKSNSPIREDMPTSAPLNPYGASKLMVENILKDICYADKNWSVARLRYFNPVGAHPSMELGEHPSGVPENLMPLIVQVSAGNLKRLKVFGGDYPTIDGTGIRDYIHVVDLAKGHLSALQKCEKETGLFTVNLGTGIGYSVLQMIHTFESVNGVIVPYDIVERRGGDVAACFADINLAKTLLGWEAEIGLEDMCRDSWNWQNKFFKQGNK